jgi:mRNA-degrading endonuclease RelE of RelBE toxin-antitoxin system
MLARMPADVRSLIGKKIGRLAADPHGKQPEVKPLSGPYKGLYRLRVGDWRVFYALDEEARLLSVADVRHRGQAYG